VKSPGCCTAGRWVDREALGALASAAYDDLRVIAAGYLRRERSGHTLQATGLVNELYLRLTQIRSVQIEDRRTSTPSPRS